LSVYYRGVQYVFICCEVFRGIKFIYPSNSIRPENPQINTE